MSSNPHRARVSTTQDDPVRQDLHMCTWEQHCTYAVAWHRCTGVWPKIKSPESAIAGNLAMQSIERFIGKWVLEQRRSYRMGILSPEHIAALEQHDGWIWEGRETYEEDGDWQRHMAAVLVMRLLYNRWPRNRRSYAPTERTLARWWDDERQKRYRAKSDQPRARLIRALRDEYATDDDES